MSPYRNLFLKNSSDEPYEGPELHTDDLRGNFQAYIQQKEDLISGLKDSLNLDTPSRIDALQSVVNQQGYQLIAKNAGTVKKVGGGVAIVSGLRGVMEN
jgi:hypothetical protein